MKLRTDQSSLFYPTVLALVLFIIHLSRDIIAQESSTRAAKFPALDLINSTEPVEAPLDTNQTSQTSTNTTESEPEQRDHFVENVYRPIFYLKTHKTGSTSIAHSLYAYTRRHGLTVLQAPGNVFVNVANTGTRRVDAIVGHHFSFDMKVINSYLKAPPKLVLTSLRLPLQRQLSWFRQQNRQFENMKNCNVRNDTLLKYYDDWKGKIDAQWRTLQERNRRDQLGGDADKIVEQFDFIFLKERLRESYECLCQRKGIRLCDQKRPMVTKNAKRKGSCVEQQLLRHRSKQLAMNAEMDMLLYEIVQRDLSECQKNISPECKCPEMIDGAA